MDFQTQSDFMQRAVLVFATGIGATAFIDVWALLRRRWLGTRLPDYALVGRWIALMPRGRFLHEALSREPAVRGELALGWLTHYLTGVAIACLPPLLSGGAWFYRPSLLLGLAVGIGTVVAPFLVMQPAMGAGVAASRALRPAAARLQSLINHALFGLGLFLAASALKPFSPGD